MQFHPYLRGRAIKAAQLRIQSFSVEGPGAWDLGDLVSGLGSYVVLCTGFWTTMIFLSTST